MKNLLNPKWLLIVNTLPMLIFSLLMFSQFDIIKSLLKEENIQIWKTLGLWLGILGFTNLIYTIFLIFKNKTVSVCYGLFALVGYITFIYVYSYQTRELIPFQIPRWMILGDLFVYVGTFLMPTLAYALFIIVLHFTPTHKENKPWASFLFAIIAPITFYVFMMVIFPLFKNVDGAFLGHTLTVLFIASSLMLLFFLVRAIYIVSMKKSAFWKKNELIWKLLVSIGLPLLGLYVNNVFYTEEGVFGDFNNVWFYLLAILNGAFICIPTPEDKHKRLLLFLARVATFSFTCYFFLVFLPFLPIAIVAVAFIGFGFLMLIPLVLFVVHANELSKDYCYLIKYFSRKKIIGISVLGFLIIPGAITINYLNDRSTLQEALSYVYSPDYSKDYNIDENSLQKTINVVKSHKAGVRKGLVGNGTPYLSAYFNWLVLDNLTLSRTKINTIEKIFFGENTLQTSSENIRNSQVEITDIKSRSSYDFDQKAWKSWVDLEITNQSDNDRFAEYATTIELPEGCWISDYYLYIGDRKEYGILSEKRAAMWVFSQIRNENRDPGILYYLTGNKVAFRVFPFLEKEVRKTGIEFLHKEPITLNFDGQMVKLGEQQQTIQEKIETDQIAYVSAQEKQVLKKVQRKPYFHFLVDVSGKQQVNSDKFIRRIEKALESNSKLSENAKISFVNTYVKNQNLDGEWRKKLENQKFEGGYYLDRAIRKTLFDAYQENSVAYPVIVAVTERIQQAVLQKDFSDFEFAFPENDYFFNLDVDGSLKLHSLTKNPRKERNVDFECMFCEKVLEYQLSNNQKVYLADNDQPSVVLKNDFFEIPETTTIEDKKWLSALKMQAQWRSLILHPETTDKKWLSLVRSSFISRVMNPLTSYLVVENEAQKEMLKRKQQQALAGDRKYDLGDEAQRMSEPSWVVLAIICMAIVWWRERKKRKLQVLGKLH